MKGNYEVGIGDRVIRAKSGDSVFIPAGTIHWNNNIGTEDVEFLCVVPKKEDYKEVYLEEEETNTQEK